MSLSIATHGVLGGKSGVVVRTIYQSSPVPTEQVPVEPAKAVDPGPGVDEDPTSQDNARSIHDNQVRYSQAHQIIKNFSLEVLQVLFGVDNPTGLVWDRDQKRTQINIVDKYTFNLDQVAVTPAIVANRGPSAWMRTSGFRQLQAQNLRTDTRTYTDLVRGGVTLSCFSRAGLEAESIAAYVNDSFQAFRDVLRKIANRGRLVPNHLGFFRIESTTMGEEALVKGGARPDLSVVPVAVSVMVQRRWAITPRDARKLQGVVIRTSTRTP